MISPYSCNASIPQYDDCVSVFAYKNEEKRIKSNSEKLIDKRNAYEIGIYNTDVPFNVKDLKIHLKNEKSTNITSIFLTSLSILAFTGIFVFHRSCNDSTIINSFNNSIEHLSDSINQLKIDIPNITKFKLKKLNDNVI